MSPKHLTEIHELLLKTVPDVNIPKISLSYESDLMLRLLATRIVISFELWKQTDPTIMQSIQPCPAFEIPNYTMYPASIQRAISKMDRSYHVCKFSIQNRLVCIRILSQKSTRFDLYAASIIQNMFVWLNTLGFYASPTCSQTIDIYLTLTDEEKVMPILTGESIGRDHANSAFTFSCKPSNEIHIYRTEEWFKVFIHESFHSFGLDFSQYNNKKTAKQILKLFHVESDVRLYESYCEVWAELIQTIFNSYHLIEQVENLYTFIPKMIEKTMDLFLVELRFSMFQCGKILHHYNITYDEITTHNSSARAKYTEGTHILSYYIIKNALMFHIDKFIAWTANHNKYSISFGGEAIDIEEKMNSYCALIKDTYKEADYLQSLSQTETWFKTNNTNPTSNRLMQTMRMSIYDHAQ